MITKTDLECLRSVLHSYEPETGFWTPQAGICQGLADERKALRAALKRCLGDECMLLEDAAMQAEDALALGEDEEG